MMSDHLSRLILILCPVVMGLTFTSCTVDQTAATDASRSGGPAKKKSESSDPGGLARRLEEAREARVARAEERAEEIAERRRRKAEEASKLAARREAERKEQAELARKKAKEKAEKLAEKRKRAAERRESFFASGERRAENREVPAAATRRGGGGFFSELAISTPGKYRSKGHGVKVNRRLLSGLEPDNAKVEIDLSEQKARIYRDRQLVIETRVSTGKSGHTTPTGTYRIQEKLEKKRSSLYGTWVDASGATVASSGDSRERPPGGVKFVGAEMPYWMRVNGGIGMHIGYVPDHPASHGCIRVPSAVQPLIYAKVGVGTTVTIVQ